MVTKRTFSCFSNAKALINKVAIPSLNRFSGCERNKTTQIANMQIPQERRPIWWPVPLRCHSDRLGKTYNQKSILRLLHFQMWSYSCFPFNMMFSTSKFGSNQSQMFSFSALKTSDQSECYSDKILLTVVIARVVWNHYWLDARMTLFACKKRKRELS